MKVWSTPQNINSNFVIEYFEELANDLKKPTIIVLDNAPWHYSSKVKELFCLTYFCPNTYNYKKTMNRSYQLVHPIKQKSWEINISDLLVKTKLGKRATEKTHKSEALAAKDFFKKVYAKFKDGYIYENKEAAFGEMKLAFKFSNKYSGFWAQDYNEDNGVLAISWPKTQNGEYFKVQLDPFEILLQKDWLSFDLYKLQWVDNNRLLGIHRRKVNLIDANDSYNYLDCLAVGNYKSEVEFEFQNPILVTHCTDDLAAQNIETREEFFRLPLDMESRQRPTFSLHHDKQTLAVARPEGLVEIYNINTGELISSIQSEFQFIAHLDIMPNGTDIFVQGGPDNGRQFYALKDGKLIDKNFDLSFKYHSGQILELEGIGTYAVSSDGNYFAVGCGYIDNTQLHIFDYESCELVKSIAIDFVHKQFKMFFAPSNDLLFVRTDQGFMLVINLKSN